ncbi:MAG: MaoC family dehydratase N-terminal domain-containing protein [Gammaproteobacteria bacterium]|nr:MaoC family dehydratase N-terminal domain-containing protein [Gammaproteobacteria bacterium]MCP5200021.1 MaoC family dehydratase N-terminal domain-containing protein [Gammaproteobacteria bacterium]
MTLDATLVGHTTRAFEHDLDARWAMAYAASLGATDACYLDNRDGRALATHPLFPVCPEWPALVDSLAANAVDMRHTVHASHDLHLLAPLVPPARLLTRGTIVGVEQRRPGIFLGWRFETTDANGHLLARTWQGNLFLGEQLHGPGRWLETPPPWPTSPWTPARRLAIAIPANLAHVYTECARIWNPIHTDAAVAAASGIGPPLLHGTASLALAVSGVVTELLDGDPRRVRRVGGRFRAPVLLPDTLELVLGEAADGVIGFELLTPRGGRAVEHGFVVTA